MILHPISRVQGNSGSTVNLVLLNPQPDAFAGLTSEVKQKVLQPVADNLIENYKVSDKIRSVFQGGHRYAQDEESYIL